MLTAFLVAINLIGWAYLAYNSHQRTRSTLLRHVYEREVIDKMDREQAAIIAEAREMKAQREAAMEEAKHFISKILEYGDQDDQAAKVYKLKLGKGEN